MIAVLAIVAGLIVGAALDHRLGWGTLISVALAVYCHRLYRQPSSASTRQGLPAPAPEDDELRPGWAARWDENLQRSCPLGSPDKSRQELQAYR